MSYFKQINSFPSFQHKRKTNKQRSSIKGGRFVRISQPRRPGFGVRINNSQQNQTDDDQALEDEDIVSQNSENKEYQNENQNEEDYEDSDKDNSDNETSAQGHDFNDVLERTLALNRQLAEDNQMLREELDAGAQASSTMFESEPTQDIRRLLSETLQLQTKQRIPVAATALSQCVPQDGEDIQITDWECWKRRFEAWLKASNITDPLIQQTYFDVYCGDKLSIALITAPEISDSDEIGYDLTVKKLNAVFRSRSSSFSLMKDFRSTTQKKNESNVAYLSRLMKLALRIWDRTNPVIDDEIMLTMVVYSTSSKMQEYAIRIGNDGTNVKNKYELLVNQARLVDSMVELKSSSGDTRILALEDRTNQSVPNSNFTDKRKLSDQDQYSSKRPKYNQYNQQSSGNQEKCYRCGRSGHFHFNCRFRNERCRFCQKNGHAIDVCRAKLRSEQQNIDYSKRQEAKSPTGSDLIVNKDSTDETKKVINMS